MENKINRGAIFKNLKKEKETQPDYNGTINVEGQEKQIALWVNTSKSGMQYFSVLVSEPYKAEEKHEPKSEGLNDLPF
jgi:uncharacterized protein (DUF736 family)